MKTLRIYRKPYHGSPALWCDYSDKDPTIYPVSETAKGSFFSPEVLLEMTRAEKLGYRVLMELGKGAGK